jgi:catechol 2,3-dioxygenase-like lactoylglutathione lyase family enzyme
MYEAGRQRRGPAKSVGVNSGGRPQPEQGACAAVTRRRAGDERQDGCSRQRQFLALPEKRGGRGRPYCGRREQNDCSRRRACFGASMLAANAPAPQPEEFDMSTTAVRPDTASDAKAARGVDMKFEIVVIPVSDVDRAKRFYAGLGWRLDADYAKGDEFRVIQFTPPGSGCSVIFGKNVTAAAPGSAKGLYLIVSDIVAARAELLRQGVAVSEPFHGANDEYVGPDEPYLFGRIRVGGPDPERRSYRSFASFSDPDGNGWLFQELTARLPGRVDAGDTKFGSPTELAAALRRAEAAHGEHEKRTGKRDDNWPGWYAEYMVREQSGEELPT